MDKTRASEIIGVDENASDTEKTDAYYKHLRNIASGFTPEVKVTGEQLTKAILEEAFVKMMDHEKIKVEISTKNKIGDFFRYYGLKLIIGLIALSLIGTTIFYKFNKPAYDLNILFIGDYYHEGDAISLEEVVKNKMPECKNVHIINLDMRIKYDRLEYPAIIYERTKTQLLNGEIDIVICEKEYFDLYAQIGTLVNLDTLKPIEINLIDESYKYYWSNTDPDLDFAPVGVKVLYGIDVSNNDLLKVNMDDPQSTPDPSTGKVKIINDERMKIVSMSNKPNNKDNCIKFLKILFAK